MREGQVLQSCLARHGELPRRQSADPHALASLKRGEIGIQMRISHG